MNESEDLFAQAQRHTAKSKRMFKWARIIIEARRKGQIPMIEAIDMCVKINQEAIKELTKGIELQRRVLNGQVNDYEK